VFGGDHAMDAAAAAPAAANDHPFRPAAGDQIVQNHVGHVFVVDARGAERVEVALQATQLDADGAGDVADPYTTEIRLAGLGAHAGKLMGDVLNDIVAAGMRISESFEYIAIGHGVTHTVECGGEPTAALPYSRPVYVSSRMVTGNHRNMRGLREFKTPGAPAVGIPDRAAGGDWGRPIAVEMRDGDCRRQERYCDKV